MQKDKIQEDAAKYAAILNKRNPQQKKLNENDLNALEIRGKTSFFSSSPQKIMSEHKEIKLRVVNLIKKRFKNPNNAFQQMDYNGKGKVTKQNFFASMVDIRNKISLNHIESFFKSEKIFQEGTPFESVDFTKFMSVFFPVIRAEQDKEEEQHLNAETERSSIPKHLRNSSQSLTGASQPSFGSKPSNNSIKIVPLDERLKKAEQLLKEKLLVNYSSARRAFLELDSDYDGYINAQDLILRLMNASSLAQGDLKMLFKLKTTQKDGRLNFSDFVKWFGPVIEPESDFYFRHDESGLRKQQLDRINTRQSQINKQNLQEMIKKMSSENIDQKLKNIIQTQWKSVNKAFMDLNKDHTHYISKDEFKSFLSQRCGFKISEKEFLSFFNRIDKDGDGKLSYPDFNTYFGFEINPGQDLFFRQQAPLPKKQTSEIIKKWDFNSTNLNEGQVKLTQKINRGHTILQHLAMKLGEEKCNDLIKKLLQYDKFGDYTIDAEVFFQNLQKFSPYPIEQWDRQCILSALMTANDDGKVNIHHLFNAKYKAELTNRAKNMMNKRSSSQSPRVVPNIPKPKSNQQLYRQFFELLFKEGKTQQDILREISYILESKSNEEEVLNSVYSRVSQISPELRNEKFKSVLSTMILKCKLTRNQKTPAQLNIKKEILASSGLNERSRFNSTRSSRNSVRVHKRSQSQLRNVPSMPPISQNKNIISNYTTIDLPNTRNSNLNQDNEEQGLGDKFIKEYQPVNRNAISPLKMPVSNSMGNLAKSMYTTNNNQNSNAIAQRRLKMLKTKLQYEWTNIYRTLISKDLDQCQFVSTTDFKAAVIRSGIYLDKDNWRTINTNFSQGDNIFYRDMSIRLGLHRAGLQSMSSANLHNYLTKIQKMKRQISPEQLRIQMRRSISQKNLEKSLQLNGERDTILKKNKGVLKRLFRNFDNNNNSSVTKYDFLNITKKCGLRLSQNEIQPFEIKEKKGGLTDRGPGQRHQLKPTLKQLQLTNSTKKIDYKKFLDRFEAKKQ